ncbi:MAG: hypothetical protein D6784_08890 [Chloroflexi bacterium]|nr:MAG: hypothetical protein D6784_08890 [Chloroflexota bacterium]
MPHLLSAHYGNLQTCGSVWVCPVCASKIASRRRTDDLTPGVENWTGQGNMVFLATFTMQHLAGDTCSEVLEAITNAHSEFWRFRAGRRIKQVYGIAGKVRSLEVTYGQNGWHWHYHVLLFVRDKLSLSQVEDMHQEMAEHWQYVVSRSGKFADSVHGFDLRHSDRQVVDYVSKYGSEGEGKIDTWTEAHELAMSTVKRSARGGLTPFQILGLSLAGEERAGQLFLEYVEAVKGKKQLHWSKGLRKAVGLLDEKTDEEIATEQEEHAYLLAQLDREHWRLIVENAARGELLKVASLGDQEALREFLSDFGINAYYPEV